MLAFDKSQIGYRAPKLSALALKDRLTIIDIAYATGNRQACAQFIEDLYADFDAAEER